MAHHSDGKSQVFASLDAICIGSPSRGNRRPPKTTVKTIMASFREDVEDEVSAFACPKVPSRVVPFLKSLFTGKTQKRAAFRFPPLHNVLRHLPPTHCDETCVPLNFVSTWNLTATMDGSAIFYFTANWSVAAQSSTVFGVGVLHLHYGVPSIRESERSTHEMFTSRRGRTAVAYASRV